MLNKYVYAVAMISVFIRIILEVIDGHLTRKSIIQKKEYTVLVLEGWSLDIYRNIMICNNPRKPVNIKDIDKYQKIKRIIEKYKS